MSYLTIPTLGMPCHQRNISWIGEQAYDPIDDREVPHDKGRTLCIIAIIDDGSFLPLPPLRLTLLATVTCVSLGVLSPLVSPSVANWAPH